MRKKNHLPVFVLLPYFLLGLIPLSYADKRTFETEGMAHDSSGVFPEQPNQSVDVTYLGNEGFLLEANGYKVLIDGPNTSDQGIYQTLPLPLRKKMANAEASFNAIDLLLITHAHHDHFDPELSVRHLLSNKRATLISTSQVIEELARQEGYEEVKDRVILTAAKRGEGETMAFDGIVLDIANLNHVPNRKWEPGYRSELDNLVFLIRLGDMLIMHTGDSIFGIEQGTVKSLGWPEKHVDLVFMEYFDRSDYSRDFVLQQMKPEFIIPMHIPPGTLEQDSGNFLSVYPGAISFTAPPEKCTFFKDGTIVRWANGARSGRTPPDNPARVEFVSNDGKPLLFSPAAQTAGGSNTLIPPKAAD